MSSHSRTRRFERDWQQLTPDQRARFKVAFDRFDSDLDAGRFRPGLRVRRMEGTDAIFEMTWAPDGRATFELGEGHQTQGERHVVWRRIGTHDVFRQP